MAKQSHDPKIWRQGWFIALPINYKLFYLYISDEVNVAGIWRPDKDNFEKINSNIKIDLLKFLDIVNEKEMRISVLPDNTWFLNYHISSNLGNIYNPRYAKMVSALKIAFLSGVPLEWIKGFANPEKIDKEAVENSYTQRVTKFVSGLPTENVIAPQNKITERHKENKIIRLKGIAPNFAMPEITYVDFGSEQDLEIEMWLKQQEFTAVIEYKNIHSPTMLSGYVQDFIKKVQFTSKLRDVEAISSYFGNWIVQQPNGKPLTIKTNADPSPDKIPNGKFGSVKKYQEMKKALIGSRKNDNNEKNNNE